MEKSIVTTGKTIELAIEAALNQLGLDRDSVSVQVLAKEKAGFLGFGAAPAKVQVTYEVPDPVPEPTAAPRTALSSASRSTRTKMTAQVQRPEPPKPEVKKPEPPKPEANKPEAPKAEAPKPETPKAPRPEKQDRPRQDKPRQDKPWQDKPRQDKPRSDKLRQPRPEKPRQPAEPKVYPVAEPGSVEAQIEEFLQGLLTHMGSKAVPHAVKTGEGTYDVELTGDGLGFLIGRRGETLDAIQHLCNYAVNRSVDGHIRINVDAEQYRAKREESLERYARKKAQQVLKARRRTTLEPMNAYERHVIHATLQEMDNITTHSTGTEPNRRVVIEYIK